MYILSYDLELFGCSGVKFGLNICGGISAERHNVYIFSYNLELFCGSGVKITLNLCDGISSGGH